MRGAKQYLALLSAFYTLLMAQSFCSLQDLNRGLSTKHVFVFAAWLVCIALLILIGRRYGMRRALTHLGVGLLLGALCHSISIGVVTDETMADPRLVPGAILGACALFSRHILPKRLMAQNEFDD